VRFITHATTLSQQWSISLCLSASLLSAHLFLFNKKDVSAKEKVSLNKCLSMNVVLIYTGSFIKLFPIVSSIESNTFLPVQ